MRNTCSTIMELDSVLFSRGVASMVSFYGASCMCKYRYYPLGQLLLSSVARMPTRRNARPSQIDVKHTCRVSERMLDAQGAGKNCSAQHVGGSSG